MDREIFNCWERYPRLGYLFFLRVLREREREDIWEDR